MNRDLCCISIIRHKRAGSLELYGCKEINEYKYSEIRGLGAQSSLPSLTFPQTVTQTRMVGCRIIKNPMQ